MLKPMTIVGVLGDTIDTTVGAEPKPLILVAAQQVPTTSLFYQALLETVISFVVKTRGDIPIETQMRAVFHRDAPGFALDNFNSMQEQVESSTFSKRLGLYLVGSFAGLAVTMVIAGLYGVLSQLVSYRRREIGVRMALGGDAGECSAADSAARVDPDRVGTDRGAGAGICDGAVYQGLPLWRTASGYLDLRGGGAGAGADRIYCGADPGAAGGFHRADGSAAD